MQSIEIARMAYLLKSRIAS